MTSSDTSGIGSKAGIVAYVGAGLATVLAAITNFGAEGGALDAARRNHVGSLVAAVALAATGLVLGASYTLIFKGAPKDTRRQRWAQGVLVAGVICIGLGVVLGVSATVRREPGRPIISLSRVSENALRVAVTGDGLASNERYEIRIGGYDTVPGKKPELVANLTSARFSPGQDGKLSWSHTVDVSPFPTTEGRPMTYIEVIVVKEANAANFSCAPVKGKSLKRAPTCLYSRLPPYTPAAQSSSASGGSGSQ